MTDTWAPDREEIAAACRRIWQAGLVSGASGNVSKRLTEDRVAITPSRLPYDILASDDIVVIDFEGDPVEDDGIPSSETLVHLAIYRARPDVKAVVHTHSIWASVVAVAGLDLPPLIDEQVVLLGGGVKVARYGLPASTELAENAVAAMEDRRAVLLRHHGAVAAGESLREAVDGAELVERLAQIFVLSRLLGSPNALPAEAFEVERNLYRMLHFSGLT